MAGSLLLGMTACGTKPTETTATPVTEATTTTTVEETTAETTPVETTAETTAEPEMPPFELGISTNDGNGNFGYEPCDYITNIQLTGITCELVDLGEYTNFDDDLGKTDYRWVAHANQDVVITFDSSKGMTVRNAGRDHSNTILEGITFTNEGNTYILTVPANTFSVGENLYVDWVSSDDELISYRFWFI